MRRYVLSALMLAALSACAGTGAPVPSFSEANVAPDAEQVRAVASPEERADAPGFFSTLFGGGNQPPATAAPMEETSENGAVTVAAPVSPPRRGLLGGSRRPTGPDALEIAPGTQLPFGQIARVCGLSNRQLGTQVIQHPERRPTYRIFDTIPNSTAPRTHYITGFADRCARQFTAALIIPSTPDAHEFVRYEGAASAQPYSVIDTAYEQIKGRVCRKRQGEPCGRRIERLSREMMFLSVYERFGSSARWAEFLVHDGAVAASDLHGG